VLSSSPASGADSSAIRSLLLLPRLAPAQLLSSCDGRGCGCCGDFGADAPGSSATAPVSAVAVATAAFALAAFGMTLAQVHAIMSRWF